jgi:hypothetical protein
MNPTKIAICVQHTNQDPILGPQPTRTETAECSADPATVVNTLRRLFQRFTLPNGGTMRVTANDRTVQHEYDDSLILLVRKLRI